MTVLLRSFNERLDGRTGQPLPDGVQLTATPRIRTFERLLRQAFEDLGHQVVDQPWDPVVADCPEVAEFKIHVHQTRREVPDGDLFYKETHLPGLFTLDTQGWGIDHSKMKSRPSFDHVDSEEASSFVAKLSRSSLASGESKHPQPRAASPPASLRPYILVPLQVPEDYVIEYHSPISVRELVEIMALYAGRFDHNVVFKLHPGNSGQRDLVDTVRQLCDGRRVFCVAGNIHSLIAASSGVCTINSGVGFESLIHGRPVAVFGDSDYQWVSHRAGTKDLVTIRNYFRNYTTFQRKEAEQFVFYYCRQHALSVLPGMRRATARRLKSYLADFTAGRRKDRRRPDKPATQDSNGNGAR